MNKDRWVEGSGRQVLGQCKKELSNPSAGGTVASVVVSGDWRSWACACGQEGSNVWTDGWKKRITTTPVIISNDFHIHRDAPPKSVTFSVL